MRRLSTISRACLSVAMLTTAGTPVASAAPPTSEPPASSPSDGDFVLPDGWTTLIDDTNIITVSVPNTWTDIDTTPRANDDGTVMPSIVAATNIQSFNDTFDEPGVLYRAISYDADQQALMDLYGLTRGCRFKNVEPYDDGAFVGLHGTWSDCGPQFDPEWHQVVASPANQSFTVVVQIQITGPDQASVVDNVLGVVQLHAAGRVDPWPVRRRPRTRARRRRRHPRRRPPPPVAPTTTIAPTTSAAPTSTTSAPVTSDRSPAAAVRVDPARLTTDRRRRRCPQHPRPCDMDGPEHVDVHRRGAHGCAVHLGHAGQQPVLPRRGRGRHVERAGRVLRRSPLLGRRRGGDGRPG